MKTIFDHNTVNALTERISALSPENKAQWGKMDVFQMLRHCTLSEEMFQGKKAYSRLFIGRLFGKMTLGGILKNAGPVKKNQPTHPELKITGSGNVELEKKKWIDLLNSYKNYPDQVFMHPFFGKMSKEQVGAFVYKHTDHHLKQFNS